MHRLGLAACLTTASFLAACSVGDRQGDDEESKPDRVSLPEIAAAAERTVEAGASAMTAEVESRNVGYELAGRVDFAAGYRACAWIEAVHRASRRRSLGAGALLWLAGAEGAIAYGDRRGSWDHVIKGPRRGGARPRCTKRGLWLDDHPPTLQLLRPRPVAGGTTGAESYLHLAMIAITRLREAALGVRSSDRTDAVEVEIDFGRYDEEPPFRDEDAWEVRPLLRRARTLPVMVMVERAGRLVGIDFEAPSATRAGSRAGPVTVSVRLSGPGEAASVPEPLVKAIE